MHKIKKITGTLGLAAAALGIGGLAAPAAPPVAMTQAPTGGPHHTHSGCQYVWHHHHWVWMCRI